MPNPSTPSTQDGVLRPAFWLAGVGLLFVLGYRWTNARAAHETLHYVALPWDAAVPFWPWTIAPYLSLNLLLPLAFFTLRTPSALDAFGRRVVAVMLTCFAVFWCWPTGNIHALPHANWPWQALFNALREFEHPVNQLPSLHIAILALVWRALDGAVPRKARLPLAGMCGLIGLSTLTTWQHGLADVACGAALGALACWRLPR